MKTITAERIEKELGEDFGYSSLVDLWGVEIVGKDYFGSYQGDEVYFLYDIDQDKYGWTSIGYGSCSGCDFLRAALDVWDESIDYDRIAAFMSRIGSQIMWKDKEEFYNYICDKDWSQEYFGSNFEESDLLKEVKRKLKKGLDNESRR